MASVFTKKASEKKAFNLKISSDLIDRKSKLEEKLHQVDPDLKLDLTSKIEKLIEEVIEKGEKELSKMAEIENQMA